MQPDPHLILASTVHDHALTTARQRGGPCLSTPEDILADQQGIHWQCTLEHPFTLAWDRVHLHGEWCPTCMPVAARRSSLGERVARAYCQQLLGGAFPRIRPGFVTEYDGYCATLRVAMEHHGRQHYCFIPHWHRTLDAFHNQQRLDRAKEDTSRLLGILLIVFPDLFRRTREEDLRGLIKAACLEGGRADLIAADYDTRPVDLRAVYSPDPDERLAELHAEAHAAGARVEETVWLGDGYPYHFVCTTLGCGRRWRNTATAFLFKRRRLDQPAGCASCSARRGAEDQRADFAAIVAAAGAKGIKVLTSPTDLYARPDARAELRCEPCHRAGRLATWSVDRGVLTKGIYGCHRCARKAKLTGEDVLARVKARGWELVSPLPQPLSNRIKVTLRCPRGEPGREHVFERVIHAMADAGCPGCFTKEGRGGNSTRRLTQAQAETAARAAGWELLDPYLGSKVPLTYRCLACGESSRRSHNTLRATPCPHCRHGGGTAGKTLPPALSR